MTNRGLDVPVGRKGNCYDGYLVRIEEMRQSIRMRPVYAATNWMWCNMLNSVVASAY